MSLSNYQALEHLCLRAYKMTHGIKRTHDLNIDADCLLRPKNGAKHGYAVFCKDIRPLSNTAPT